MASSARSADPEVSQLGSARGFLGGIQGQIALGEAVTADASYTVPWRFFMGVIGFMSHLDY